jgi:hypothetical protein
MDDTLVMQGKNNHQGAWYKTDFPTSWDEIRVSIATIQGKPVFEGDTYYRCGDSFIARATYTYDYGWLKDCTLTPPKPKSILDSSKFTDMLVAISDKSTSYGDIEKIKQFIRKHKEKI